MKDREEPKMVTRRLMLAALICTMALAAQPAFAGGETGNGKRAVTRPIFAGGETGNGKVATNPSQPR